MSRNKKIVKQGDNRNNRNRNYRNDGKKERGINQEMNDTERAIKKAGTDWRSSQDNGRRSNDVSWYAVSEALLRDSASYSFNNPLGVGITGILDNADAPNVPRTYFVPGVMELDYTLSVGRSQDRTSAINLAAQRLYTFVRHANAGSANYDAPDLMMYIMAIREVVNVYYHCVKAYGVANVYAQTNRYLPDGILRAMKFNGDELRQNLADFRYQLNVIAAKMNSFAIPNNMNLFKRTVWLASSVFKDADTVKSQTYTFTPYIYRTWSDGTTTQPGSTLQPHFTAYQAASSTSTWLGYLNSMLDALLTSEDVGIMSGDILKAYGNERLFTFTGVAEDYVVIPEYNPEVLMQIENMHMTILSGFGYGDAALDTYAITQNVDTNAIIYAPWVNVGTTGNPENVSDVLNCNRLLNIRNDSPTPADVMVATRLSCGGFKARGSSGGSENFVFYDSFGTETVAKATIWTANNSATRWSSVVFGTYLNADAAGPTALTVLEQLSKFDWHPIVYIMPTQTSGHIEDLVTDLSNYTTVDTEGYRKLNETALLSMLDVPSLTFG